MTQDIKISWDIGTAIDFFVSIVMLHDPSTYGLRAAWAAGMRSRLPNADRETLEDLKPILAYPPFVWLHQLEQPKDGHTLLAALEAIPPERRLIELYLTGSTYEMSTILAQVAEAGEWTEDDLDAMREAHKEHSKKFSNKEVVERLDLWAQSTTYGDRLLSALRSYYDVFFAEEERRIRPALQIALDAAQAKAAELTLEELVEELSQGVAFDTSQWGDDLREVTFVPSYWSGPLIWFFKVDDTTETIYFGARPSNASIVPGEVVPDALVSVLKALSDPTRLRIMHYLTTESLTPTQLANRLRLRPPTVVHHLKVMRLAGLVRVRISEGKEKSYAARTETVESTFEILRDFMAYGGSDLIGLENTFAEESPAK